MRKLLHVLTLSLLFSCNVSCAQEESFSLSSIVLSAFIVPGIIIGGIFAAKIIKIFRDQYRPCKPVLSDLELEAFHNFTQLHRACENGDLEKVRSSVTTKNINQLCYTDYNQKGYDW